MSPPSRQVSMWLLLGFCPAQHKVQLGGKIGVFLTRWCFIKFQKVFFQLFLSFLDPTIGVEDIDLPKQNESLTDRQTDKAFYWYAYSFSLSLFDLSNISCIHNRNLSSTKTWLEKNKINVKTILLTKLSWCNFFCEKYIHPSK